MKREIKIKVFMTPTPSSNKKKLLDGGDNVHQS